ncbi:hypothetical protein ASPVEDRAFT_170685 [Aspergillus versicolor CBS 583.65]|uniref:Zn(2)-C6 fungal-type domain-containing protein n=1 Tax=Aspergillus versicolor CBS 583.65 TaxID=1036611 RepID=A0A1L9PPD7_ASPVE|nr:uncharacterized protein ASPVEDRAFT_170685 [Aspergillus versicolor CBS 583.65]OJJ03316.1 hypothetical protein ASPVEDRAFT_170685 [Aspergillus versicolor CBS 583.65]
MSRRSDNSAAHPFQCSHPGCSAAYQRKEHLNRHLAHHSQGARSSCPYCDSTLARSDLLRRHIKNYHPEKQAPPSRAQKACSACHARKERCDGGYPCSRCQRRGVTCSYTRLETACERQADFSADLTASVPSSSRWIAQDYIDIYFDEFHPIWPFLFRATFKPSEEPCVLLQSMAMMGLWIKGFVNCHYTLTRSKLADGCMKSQWYMPETVSPDEHTPWPIPTYQSILLQLIFALLIAKQESTLDLNLRFQLPDEKYKLLTSLVETCRQVGLFNYPNMLARFHPSAPIALIWVSVEEIKRFGLALYKLCRMCTRTSLADKGGSSRGLRSELLTLADLDFCMPDSDEIWNAPPSSGTEWFRSTALQQSCRDNRDPDGWISQTAVKLHDEHVGLDWI